MEIHPNPLNAYATYPHKSTNYYGFPQFPDVLVNFARKDVLCDGTEQANFMGLAGMIGEMVMRCDLDLSPYAPKQLDAIAGRTQAHWRALAQLITALENGKVSDALKTALHAAAKDARIPVVGITGTGGAGKSSLTDELIRRLRLDQADALHVAVISIDPSRRKSGGALLGDRIRMNAIGP